MEAWLQQLNAIDIALLVVVAAWSVKGLVRGLSKEVAGLLILLLALLSAVLGYRPAAAWIETQTLLDTTKATVLAFTALFVGMLLVGKLLSALLSAFFDVSFSPFVSRSGGLLMGLLKAAFAASLVFRVVSSSEHEYLREKFIEDSWFGSHAEAFIPEWYDQLASVSDPWMPVGATDPAAPATETAGQAGGGEEPADPAPAPAQAPETDPDPAAEE